MKIDYRFRVISTQPDLWIKEIAPRKLYGARKLFSFLSLIPFILCLVITLLNSNFILSRNSNFILSRIFQLGLLQGLQIVPIENWIGLFSALNAIVLFLSPNSLLSQLAMTQDFKAAKSQLVIKAKYFGFPVRQVSLPSSAIERFQQASCGDGWIVEVVSEFRGSEKVNYLGGFGFECSEWLGIQLADFYKVEFRHNPEYIARQADLKKIADNM